MAAADPAAVLAEACALAERVVARLRADDDLDLDEDDLAEMRAATETVFAGLIAEGCAAADERKKKEARRGRRPPAG